MTYNKLQEMGKKFQVIFVSSDKDEESFKEYYSSMPWLALPFGSTLKKKLSTKFDIGGTYYLNFVYVIIIYNIFWIQRNNLISIPVPVCVYIWGWGVNFIHIYKWAIHQPSPLNPPIHEDPYLRKSMNYGQSDTTGWVGKNIKSCSTRFVNNNGLLLLLY